MTKFLLALHLIFAVFTIGPLVHAATTAGRGIRRGDGAATASSSRLLRIYAIASVLVVGAGFALMSRSPLSFGGGASISVLGYDARPNIEDFSITRHIGEFGQTWIWLSLLLWVVAIALVLFVAVPTLNRATKLIANGDSVVALTARVAVAGGVVGILFIVIVVLMVYRPGQ